MVTIQVQQPDRFRRRVFAHADSSPEEARRIATYLTTANLTGHDSHGVIRVPRLCPLGENGRRHAGPDRRDSVDTPSLAVVDGEFGYGQTVAPQAVRIGIEKCKKAGLAAVSLRNAGHIGRVGEWAEMAAAEGLVSIHFVNAAGSMLVAPFGGVERRLSTAPYCVGIPRHGAGADHARFRHLGRRRRQGAGGEPRRQETAGGRAGRCRRHASEDPALLYGPCTSDGPRDHAKGKGAIRAFGEHKGSGLAFMCEMLGGALTGTGATRAGPAVRQRHVLDLCRSQTDRPRQFLRRRNVALHRLFKAAKPAAGVSEC